MRVMTFIMVMTVIGMSKQMIKAVCTNKCRVLLLYICSCNLEVIKI